MSIDLDEVDFEFQREISMPFNAQLSEISELASSEFMCQDSILQIFDHEQPTNPFDQGMVSELDLLNEAFIQDS